MNLRERMYNGGYIGDIDAQEKASLELLKRVHELRLAEGAPLPEVPAAAEKKNTKRLKPIAGETVPLMAIPTVTTVTGLMTKQLQESPPVQDPTPVHAGPQHWPEGIGAGRGLAPAMEDRAKGGGWTPQRHNTVSPPRVRPPITRILGGVEHEGIGAAQEIQVKRKAADKYKASQQLILTKPPKSAAAGAKR